MSFARRFYDLSQPVFTDCPEWAKYEPVSITRPFTTAMNGYNAEKVVLMTHAGTHVDAPAHFFDEAPAVDAMPLDAFAGTALFVDLRHKPKGAAIGAADLAPIADRITPGDVVLLNTGWGHQRGEVAHRHALRPVADERHDLLDAEILDAGCCGMAGSFGFERDEYALSIQIGERALLPAVRGAGKHEIVMADGFSCREQIAQTTRRRALHLAEVLDMAQREGPEGPARRYPERYARRRRAARSIAVGAAVIGAVGAALWAQRKLA